MSLNPNWKFLLWTDEDNRELIASHYPDFLGTYDNYTVPMKRVDAIRLFYVHHFGGLYIDLDFACLKPFDINATFEDGVATFSYQYRGPQINLFHGAHMLGMVANNVFAAPPFHPLLAFAIDRLPTVAGATLLSATGPNFLSERIRSYGLRIATPRNNVHDWHVRVYDMPRIYANGWKGVNPCREGSPADLAACNASLPGTMLATFWTMTWKQAEANHTTAGPVTMDVGSSADASKSAEASDSGAAADTVGRLMLQRFQPSDECGQLSNFAVKRLNTTAAQLASVLDAWLDASCQQARTEHLRVGVDLRACGNLAPAGTGSSSLTRYMREASPMTNRIHHFHYWRVSQPKCFDNPHKHVCGAGCCIGHNFSMPVPEAPVTHQKPCYVMTLRDPATRFESVVRYAVQGGRKHLMYGRWGSASGFMRSIRNSSSKDHAEAVGIISNSAVSPRYSPKHNMIYGGVNGLTGQTDYLRMPDCLQQTLLFVCQERFSDDWKRLNAESISKTADASEISLGDNRSDANNMSVLNAGLRSEHMTARGAERTGLSEADRTFLRRCLYPVDDILHERFCRRLSKR